MLLRGLNIANAKASIRQNNNVVIWCEGIELDYEFNQSHQLSVVWTIASRQQWNAPHQQW